MNNNRWCYRKRHCIDQFSFVGLMYWSYSFLVLVPATIVYYRFVKHESYVMAFGSQMVSFIIHSGAFLVVNFILKYWLREHYECDKTTCKNAEEASWWCYRKRHGVLQFAYVGWIYWLCSLIERIPVTVSGIMWCVCFLFNFILHGLLFLVVNFILKYWLRKHYVCNEAKCRYEKCSCGYADCPERRNEDTIE